MILKIRASGKSGNLSASESWRFIEGVTGLHYSKYPSEITFRKECEQWVTPTEVQDIWFTIDRPVDDEILFASFGTENMGLVHLVCNTTCYLLNDQGKTIERLI